MQSSPSIYAFIMAELITFFYPTVFMTTVYVYTSIDLC
jgi:hypothetical protein